MSGIFNLFPGIAAAKEAVLRTEQGGQIHTGLFQKVGRMASIRDSAGRMGHQTDATTLEPVQRKNFESAGMWSDIFHRPKHTK